MIDTGPSQRGRLILDCVEIPTRKRRLDDTATSVAATTTEPAPVPTETSGRQRPTRQISRSHSSLSIKPENGNNGTTTRTKNSFGNKEASKLAEAARRARTRSSSIYPSLGNNKLRERSRSCSVLVKRELIGSNSNNDDNNDNVLETAKGKGKAKAKVDIVCMTDIVNEDKNRIRNEDENHMQIDEVEAVEREPSIVVIGNLDLLVLAGEAMHQNQGISGGIINNQPTFSLVSIAQAMGVDPCQLSIDQDNKHIIFNEDMTSFPSSSSFDRPQNRMDVDHQSDDDIENEDETGDTRPIITRTPSLAPSTTSTLIDPRTTTITLTDGNTHTSIDTTTLHTPRTNLTATEDDDLNATEEALLEKQAQADATNPLIGKGQLARTRGDEDGSGNCSICLTDVEDILADAEKDGKGGIDGGLAIWACEQPNCGTLFCVPCALEWTNRAIDRNQHPNCPACTRIWDVISLEITAKAFDPAVAEPIHNPPVAIASVSNDPIVLRFGAEIYQHYIDYEARHDRVPGEDPMPFVRWVVAVVRAARVRGGVAEDSPEWVAERAAVIRDARRSWTARRLAMNTRAREIARNALIGTPQAAPEIQALIDRYRDLYQRHPHLAVPLDHRLVHEEFISSRLDRLFALDPTIPNIPFDRDVVWNHVQNQRNQARRSGLHDFGPFGEVVDNLFGGPGLAPRRRAPRSEELDILFANYPAARTVHLARRRGPPGQVEMRDRMVQLHHNRMIQDQARRVIERRGGGRLAADVPARPHAPGAVNGQGVALFRPRIRGLEALHVQMDDQPVHPVRERVVNWATEVGQAGVDPIVPEAAIPRAQTNLARAEVNRQLNRPVTIDEAIRTIINFSSGTPAIRRARKTAFLATESAQDPQSLVLLNFVKSFDPIGHLAKASLRMLDSTHEERVRILTQNLKSSRRSLEEMGVDARLLDRAGLPRFPDEGTGGQEGSMGRRERVRVRPQARVHLDEVPQQQEGRNDEGQRVGRVRFTL